jgi:hypothetical protein
MTVPLIAAHTHLRTGKLSRTLTPALAEFGLTGIGPETPAVRRRSPLGFARRIPAVMLAHGSISLTGLFVSEERNLLPGF